MKAHLVSINGQNQVALEGHEVKKEKELTFEPKASNASKSLSCLAYGIVSVSITLFNKAIFSVYNFEYPAFVALVQVILSIAFMILLSESRVIDFELRSGRGGLLGLKWAATKKIFPLAFFWMLYVQSGLQALNYLTVPMFGVLRRSTTLITVLGEYLVFGRVTQASSMAAILVMVSGAALAGATDLSFNATGYAWVGVCVVSTAAFLILIRTLGKELGLNQHALLLYNNVISLPMVLGWFLLATDEPKNVLSATQWQDPSFVVFLLISASQAFLLNLCMFWCTTVNSALVTTIVGKYSCECVRFFLSTLECRCRMRKYRVHPGIKGNIKDEEYDELIHWPPKPIVNIFAFRSTNFLQNTGQMKDLITTCLGLFIFGDVLFNAANLLGVGLGLSGGIAYSAISYIKGKQGKPREPVSSLGR